jgi:hypothetical protein
MVGEDAADRFLDFDRISALLHRNSSAAGLN